MYRNRQFSIFPIGEVLRTVLATKIGFNLEDLRNRNASFFEQIEVIVPTTMVEDNLNRFLADHFGATPGIKFSNVASWMFKVLGQSLSNTETSQVMDWTFYEILRQKQTENPVDCVINAVGLA